MIRTTLSLTFALSLFSACGGASNDDQVEQDVVGEGAAYLVTADIEETGDEANDETAAAGADDADLDGLADESADDLGAEPVTEGAETCDFGAAKRRVRAAFDADGDGRLSPEERATLIAELDDVAKARKIGVLARKKRHHNHARARWAFDVNGDRVLDEAERAELVTAMESRCALRRARALERFDANGDGTLDDAERTAAREARRAAAKERHEAFVARHDADGDGQLSREERKAGRRADLAAKRDAVRARFDVDGDGTLSSSELEALKAAVRDRIANGTRMSDGA